MKDEKIKKRFDGQLKMNKEIELENLIFLIEISDGYSFRNLIEYLSYTNTEGTFILQKKKIIYSEANGDGDLANHLVIKTCNLSKYIFNLEDKDQYLLSVQLSELRANTKSIGKKDVLRLYKRSDDINLYIQILSTNRGGRGNVLFVKTKSVDPEECQPFDDTIVGFTRSKDEPNTNCIISDFAKTMKNLAQYKSDHILLKGYPNGILASSYLEGHINGRGEEFGNCEAFAPRRSYPDINSIISKDSNNNNNVATPLAETKKVRLIIKQAEELPLIKMTSRAALALGKTNNTSSNGIVKMYLEAGKPCRFILPIGYYGKLTIYIRDNNVNLVTPTK